MTVPLFPSRPVPALLRRAVLAGSVLLPALGLACSSAPPPAVPASAATPPEASPSTLRPGIPVEREIGGGETHEYPLALAAGQYLRLRIDQPGVDVAAKLVGAAGEELAKSDIPRWRLEPEVLSLLPTGTGEVWLAVSPSSVNAAPGRYRIEVELRTAGPGDTERVAAARSFADGLLSFKEGEAPTRESLAFFQEALSLWAAAGDLRGQVDALVRIGEAYKTLDQYEDALPPCEKALALARQSGYQRGEALAYKTLADIYDKRKDWDEAMRLYRQALPLWEALGEDGYRGSTLYAIAGVLYQFRQSPLLPEALGYLRQALPLRQGAGDLGGTANVLNVIGLIETDQGQFADALEHLHRALELARSVRDLSVQAVAHYSLGRAHRARGELEEALESFKESLDLNRRLGERDYELSALNAMGSIYLALGEPDMALSYYQEMRDRSRDGNGSVDHEVRALNNIGWTYRSQEKYETALERCQEALALEDAVQDASLKAQTLHYIGVIHTAAGRPAEGLPWLTEALRLREAGTPSERTLSLLEIGTAYQALNNTGEADRLLGEACRLAASLHNTGHESTCMYRWALLDRDLGALENALKKIERSIEIIESVRSGVTSDKLRTSFFASKRGYYELYVDLLMRLGRVEEAFEASERARARGLVDLLAESRIDLHQSIDPELSEREINLGARLAWLSQRMQSGSQPADLQAEMIQVEEALERLEAEIKQRYARYAEIRYPEPLELSAARELLDGQTALLQYFLGQDRSFLFVLTHEGLTSHELPSAADIALRVQAVRRHLKEPRSLSLGLYRAEAYDLYSMLLGPAGEVLRHKTHLLISPDDALHLLPFEALLTEEGGTTWPRLHYLLRRHVVSYIPSASVLAGLQAARAPAGGGQDRVTEFLAFADPVYDGEPLVAARRDAGPARLARLPESGREVSAIAKLYPEDRVALYLREAATEVNVKHNPRLQGARRIHFATHGLLDGLNPRLSGLVLTRQGLSEEDGHLRVLEIFKLELSADIVVLSACETGLGQEVRSEGIVGLTRAFLYAGARSLLVSLWKTADVSTPDLMESFYRHLGTSDTRAAALRASKLEMIADGVYAHPYFWAPFVLAGDQDGTGIAVTFPGPRRLHR